MADRNQFTKEFIKKMTESSASTADSFERMMNSLSSIIDRLDRIDSNLQQFAGSAKFKSQSSAKDFENSDRPFGQHHANFYDEDSPSRRNKNRHSSDIWDAKEQKDFASRLEKSILDAFGGDAIRKGFQGFFREFSKQLGENSGNKKVVKDVQDILIKTITNTVKNSGPAKDTSKLVENVFGQVFNKDTAKGVSDLVRNLKLDENADLNTLFSGLQKLDFGKVGNSLVSSGSKLTNVFTELTSTTSGSVGGLLLIQHATKRLGKAFTLISDGIKEFSKTLSEASTKYESSKIKDVELANERLRADVETVVKEPFNILKKAADEVYTAWSQNARLITGTQGYNKEDLQNLMAAYAKRLESEGLSSVVSSTDIYNNLAKVIESGLTGQGAVEFAYQATRLNAAVPNQDFFSYVESYASVAANAISAGKSEAEALAIANKSLEEFSNSLLYASRGLTGGYATSLKNAESTYSAAVKIAQTARSDNLNSIASSLLAIQGYVGSIAPDLASSLTEKIYQLATGGNAEDIVALRSLAGINASNTEFLRALANNPKQILSNMFDALGTMFTQSSDAYMEKAEGYASLFGLSAEALQRIDFQSLANAIRSMNSTSESLDENIKLLKEGQTTTTTDQLKIAQINQYMIEEGLAYVIDNEAAQMIQEHMWDEQMKRELMEAEYGVNIVGTAAALLQKIVSGIDNIIGIINPAHWFAGPAEIIQSVVQEKETEADIASVLKAGVVGKGKSKDYYNLLTRNADLNLTKSLVELLGGQTQESVNKSNNKGWLSRVLESIISDANIVSSIVEYNKAHDLWENKTYTRHASSSGVDHGGTGGKFGETSGKYGETSASRFESSWNLPSSKYAWGSISKSTASIASQLLSQSVGEVSSELVSNIANTTSQSTSVVVEKFKHLLSGDYIKQEFVKQGKTYSDWRAAVAAQGVADVDQALRDAGYKPEDVEAYYQTKEVEVGMQEKQADREAQNAFMKTGSEFMNVRFWSEHSSPVKTSLTSIHSVLDSLMNLHTTWKDAQITQLQSILDHQITWKGAQSTQLQTIGNNQVDWKEFFNTSWLESEWKKNFVGESGLFTKFFQEFVNKFVTHTYYDASGYKYSDVTDIQRREDAEKGSAVYALADALTGNLVDLKDPQVQTNAILAQILVVVSAIMNQNNNVASTVSLSDALSGLALGLTTSTPFDQTPTVS